MKWGDEGYGRVRILVIREKNSFLKIEKTAIFGAFFEGFGKWL